MKNTSYFGTIASVSKSLFKGLGITFKHLGKATIRRKPTSVSQANYFTESSGLVTLTYPFERLPTPDHARYQLDCEIDDCIVCDKCVKICPVDCIEIDAIRATEQIGIASDGSPIRIYAAKFDIDMAKCCFCGLCTTVCPTECLTMNGEYDFSTFDVIDLNVAFAKLLAEEATEKRQLFEQYQIEKQQQVAAKTAAVPASEKPVVRPVFRPTIKPSVALPEMPEPKPQSEEKLADPIRPRPAFRPTMKPSMPPKPSED